MGTVHTCACLVKLLSLAIKSRCENFVAHVTQTVLCVVVVVVVVSYQLLLSMLLLLYTALHNNDNHRPTCQILLHVAFWNNFYMLY